MIFDIVKVGVSYLCGPYTIACYDAPFPKHSFKMDVRAKEFEGSIRVDIEVPEGGAEDPDDSMEKYPATVGDEEFDDSYGVFILSLLRQKMVISWVQTYFYFKVVA